MRAPSRLLFQNHHRNSPLIGMGNTEMYTTCSQEDAPLLGFSMENQYRGFRILSLHFCIQPGHAFCPSRSQRFKKGLFGGKTRGKMGDRITVPIAEFSLRRSKHPFDEATFLPAHDLSESLNIHNIYTSAYDHFATPSRPVDMKRREDSIFRI
jgi:hypothetical protein